MYNELVTVGTVDSEDERNLALLGRPDLNLTFTKIHCWELTQYQKCVFLDADTLVSSPRFFHVSFLLAFPKSISSLCSCLYVIYVWLFLCVFNCLLARSFFRLFSCLLIPLVPCFIRLVLCFVCVVEMSSWM